MRHSVTVVFCVSLVVLSSAFFATLVALQWSATADDAFITFRYSMNLARGIGPTFNERGERAEGYTNFLWMLIMALPHLCGLDVVLFSKCLGVLSSACTAALCFLLTFALARTFDRGIRVFSSSVALAAFFLAPATSVHAGGGMETSFYTFLIALLAWAACSGLQKGFSRSSSRIISVLALLVGLTRPDGNLVSGVLLALLVLLAPGGARRGLIRAAAECYVVPGIVYYVWRSAYYGCLFPLPFHLKVLTHEFLPGARGVGIFVLFIATSTGVFLPLLLIQPRREHALLLAPALAVLVFYLFPHHLMDWGMRYVYPVYPLILCPASAGLATLLSCTEHRMSPLRTIVWRAAICAFVPLAILSRFDMRAEIEASRGYAAGMKRAHIALGKSLEGFLNVNPSAVLVIADAGAVPYYSRWQTVDSYGLNDPHIAVRKVYSPDYVSYIFGQNPTLVVLLSRNSGLFQPRLFWEQRIYDYCIRKKMVALKTLEFRPDYFLYVMGLPDSPVASYLRESGLGAEGP